MFAFIKAFLAQLVANITGRKCKRCEYNRRGHCIHPAADMYGRCFGSFTKPGYEKYRPRYLKPKNGLTKEEQHQLQKIQNVLQEAENNARESGLLED